VPIVSISKIQHRRGLMENLPQLASGELGWAINQRRLFIGNGTAAEGAPDVGNTEILTEFSNIIDLLDTYTYKAERVGYAADTGGSGSDVVRSIQEKLDDTVSILDYGVKLGLVSNEDASANAAAINNALYDVYCREINPEVRRAIYFPAGTYRIRGESIKVPAYAKLFGDGIDSTIILQEDDTQDTVIELADSLQQTGANQGTSGAITSRFIDIRDMTIRTSEDIDVLTISTTLHTQFSRVKFQGGVNLEEELTGLSFTCVRIGTPVDGITTNIFFNGCEFTDHSAGVSLDNRIRNIKFDQCRFFKHFIAVSVGNDLSNTPPNIPQGVTITNSLFDKIYSHAIKSDSSVRSVTSAFNTYLDVGATFLGAEVENVSYPVLEFAGEGCVSFGDYFARTDVAAAIFPRVERFETATFIVDAHRNVQYGSAVVEPGQTVILSNDVSLAESTGISIALAKADAAEIHYKITRADQVRIGTIRLAQSATAQDFDDDFFENDGDIGVTFSLDSDSSASILMYETTDTGDSATMKYQIRYFV
jgi:hypothetical protein